MKNLLKKLGIKKINSGSSSGENIWYETSNKDEKLTSFSPTDNSPIASVKPANSEICDQVINKAQEAFHNWQMTPAPKRGLVIRELGQSLRNYKEPLGKLISLEMGKIKAEGLGEVQEMIDICDFAAGLSRQLYGKTMHSERPRHRMYEQWHPLGVIGIITSFNFPAAVWAWNAAIAGICGNTMVWKPSSQTPLTAIAIQNIINEIMRKHKIEGVFNLLIGSGKVVGNKIMNHDKIPLISFTGSTYTGKKVAKVVAGRLGKTILELGGNNAIIVSPSADLDMAVRTILFGAVGTAGQRCTSTRRVIMHSSIADKLTNKIVKAYKQITIGDPLKEENLMGPLVNEEAVKNMLSTIKKAQDEGGKVLFGGQRIPELGKNFVKPCIIKMPKQTEIVKKETFAPILYLLPYQKNIENAIQINNDVPQGLSSAIFTNNLLESELFLSHIGSDCGIANVNLGTSGAEIGGAFGGEKETGGGREAGSDAWKYYMRRQTNTLNWSQKLPLAQGIKFGN